MLIQRRRFGRPPGHFRRDAFSAQLHHRIVRIDHHLALELRTDLLCDRGQRAIGHGNEHYVAEGHDLLDAPGLRFRPRRLGRFLRHVGVAVREHDLVPRLRPERAERRADTPRADDADLRGLALRERRWNERCSSHCEKERAAFHPDSPLTQAIINSWTRAEERSSPRVSVCMRPALFLRHR